MTGTTLYLVCYDVANPRRLRKVHRYLKERAVAVQYSVFVLFGDDRRRDETARGVEERIDTGADDVRIYTLPRDLEVQTLGRAEMPASGILLVGAGGAFVSRGQGFTWSGTPEVAA